MKIRTLFITLIIGLFSAATFAQTNEEKYKTAEEMMDTYQFEEAINILIDLCLNEPDNHVYFKDLAWSYLNLYDYDNAKKYFGQAIEINPECIKCYSHLARAYFETELIEEAEAIVSKGFELSDTTAHLYMTRGLIYQAQQEMDAAMLDFTKAIQLEPDNTDYLITRANYYIGTNELHFAYSDISEAIKLEPEKAEYYYYRAYILLNLNLLDESIIDIKKALQINPEVADYYNLQFSIYFSMKEYELAEQSLMKSLEIFPDSHMVYINLADLYFQTNRIDKYCEANHKALSLIPAEYLSEFADLQQTTDKYCNDTRMPYYFVRGLNKYNNGEYIKTIEFLTDGLGKIGESSVLENLIASSYIALKNYGKAKEFFMKSYSNKAMLQDEVIDFYSIDLQESDIEWVANSYIVKSDFGLAMIHLKDHEIELAKQRANAAKDMAETMEEFDGKEFVYNLLALIEIYNGNFDAANKQLEIAKEKNVYYQQTYLNTAIIKILHACKYKSSKFEFEFSEYYNNMRLKMPKLKVKKGQENLLNEALEICNIAIKTDSQNGYAYLIKAKILFLLKDDSYKQVADKAVEYGIENAYLELNIKK